MSRNCHACVGRHINRVRIVTSNYGRLGGESWPRPNGLNLSASRGGGTPPPLGRAPDSPRGGGVPPPWKRLDPSHRTAQVRAIGARRVDLPIDRSRARRVTACRARIVRTRPRADARVVDLEIDPPRAASSDASGRPHDPVRASSFALTSFSTEPFQIFAAKGNPSLVM